MKTKNVKHINIYVNGVSFVIPVLASIVAIISGLRGAGFWAWIAAGWAILAAIENVKVVSKITTDEAVSRD